ncbi:MAG: TRAP transporter large permease [Clostridium sp.]|uniref:TRAP transporter large permease n=1 Tax=Clostridium sp. TaxID=1506 RepID=UPI003D6D3011
MSIALSAGLIIAIVLIILLLAGIPISVALGIASLLAILPTLNFDAAVLTAAQRTFSGISVFTLIAIPFFILAGNIMNKGGIAIRLINFAKILSGRIPGAMAHTNVVANMMFGAISGSGVAATSAMGSIIGPIAVEDGYDRDYMATVNIATGPTGLLIPPSNVLITYSLVSGGTSVAALFMAGYVPGILWGFSCMVVAFFIARKKGYRTSERVTLKQALKITLEAVPSLLLILIVIGGIVTGIFTATEGSVVAVAYSLILSIFFYKTIKVKDLYDIYKESAEMTGIIVFLIGVSSVMAWVMAFTAIPSAISTALLTVSSNHIIILLIINIVLLFIGTFMDITPAILIFTPIFLPICMGFGMSAIQFGIMVTFNLCIGTITPPVGNILFVGVKVAKTTIENVMLKLIPYYIAIFAVLLLTTYVPAITMWLPTLMGYSK